MSTISRRQLLAAGSALSVGLVAKTQAQTAPHSSTERPVRRKDYELTEAEARYVIEHTDHAVLATADDSGTPYATPITPFLYDGKIYFHGTKDPKSRKLNNLKQNPRVSIAWVGTSPIKEDEFTVKYVSAIVAGTAKEVTDAGAKQRIFEAFCNRFVPSQARKKALEVIAGSINDAVVWEVTIEKLTGKAKAKQPFFASFAAPVQHKAP